MNTKNLIEAVKFQVSVKPQDDFMREVAEGLEKLYSDNMKLLSDYDAACDELKKWQKLQPIGCPTCHRGCFSNDKFCPHCGTSLRNSKGKAKIDITEKYPHCVLSSNGAILTESLEEYDKLIADISAEAVKEFAERLKKEVTYYEDDCGNFVPFVDCRDIDKAYEEVVGDAE